MPPWLLDDEVKNEKEPQAHEAPATLSHLKSLVVLAVTQDNKDAKANGNPKKESRWPNEARSDSATRQQ